MIEVSYQVVILRDWVGLAEIVAQSTTCFLELALRLLNYSILLIIQDILEYLLGPMMIKTIDYLGSIRNLSYSFEDLLNLT